MSYRSYRSLKSVFTTIPSAPRLTVASYSWLVIAVVCYCLTISIALVLESTAQTKSDSPRAQAEDPNAFTGHVIVIANQEFPKLKLKATDRPLLVNLADTGKLSLENLYRMVKKDTEPGKEDEQIKRFLKSLMEIHPGVTQQTIPPWDDVKNRLRPQIFPSRYLNQTNKAIVFRPLHFSRKLMEGFVIDSENTFQYVTSSHLKTWHVDVDQLANLAYENLNRTSQDLKMNVFDAEGKDAKGKYISVSTKDGYDAARVLLPDMQKKLHKELGNPCYIAIPNRDFLVAWSTDFSKKERFAEQVHKDFQSRHHPLTPIVLKLDDDTISPSAESKERVRSKRSKHRSKHRAHRARTKEPGKEPGTQDTLGSQDMPSTQETKPEPGAGAEPNSEPPFKP